MGTTLRWPEGRGKFVDDGRPASDNPDAESRERLEVFPGTTVEIDDQQRVDHYLDRGFERADDDSDDANSDDDDDAQDGSGADDDGDESGDGGFDAQAFTDRTPVSDVVDDIEAGEADGHLDAVLDADDRVTVEQAVLDRRDEIGGD